jgi:flavin reductase (DIM6/NTAB) family NADH-FMN oxidoreductase RutF
VSPRRPPGAPDDYDRMRRRILWSMPSGLYVLGTRAGSRRNLMTISWTTQVATTPKLVGVGVETTSVTHGLIVDGGVFVLNLLSRSARPLVRRFAKPVDDADVEVDDTGSGTMHGERVTAAVTGAPVLEVARAYLDCEVRHVLPLGSHSWFVGEVVGCGERDRREGAPREDEAPDETGVLRMEDTSMNYGG